MGRLLLFSLTAFAFLMVAYAMLVEPPPLWVPIVYAAVYLSLLGWGAMNLRLQMFGEAICEVPEADGMVALTFDDGPDPVGTRLALKLLKAHDAHATFFVVGKKAARHPDVLRDILAEGHSLGLHGYVHRRLYALLPPLRVTEDIERCRDVIFEATGVRPGLFRPPVGQMSPRTALGAERAGALVVGWNVRALDGLKKTTDKDCIRRISRGLKAGAVLLLHDAWEREEVDPKKGIADCPAGIRVLEKVLVACKERGLEVVGVEKLLTKMR